MRKRLSEHVYRQGKAVAEIKTEDEENRKEQQEVKDVK